MVLKSVKKAQKNAHFGNFSEALLACKVLEAEQLKEVARQAAEAKMPLEQFLVQKNLVDPAAFTLAAAAYFNMAPLALPDNFTINQDLLCGKSEDFWIKAKAVPVAKLGGRFTIALADPFNLPAQEEVSREKSEKVVKSIAGKGSRTKTIVDKNGRRREVKVAEKRKTLPVYIPESLYQQFDEITTAYGISNNSAICQLIRDYVTEKKGVLE